MILNAFVQSDLSSTVGCLPIKQFIVTRLERDGKTKSKMEATLFIWLFLWINRVSLIDKSVKIILAFPLRSRYIVSESS
jgi:hypothetical protein